MASGLLYFSANCIALTSVLLIGAGCLISNPRSFGARILACVALSCACYLIGRFSYAVPLEVQIHFWFWPFLLVLMNIGSGCWMILAYSVFQDERRFPRWVAAAFALQVLLSTVNAMGYLGRDSSVLLSPAYPATVNFAFGQLPIAMQASFSLLTLYWAARGWRADLDEGRRLLRGLFLVLAGGLSLGINTIEVYLVNAPYPVRSPVDNVLTLFLAGGYLAVALVVLRFDTRVLERLVRRVQPLPDAATDSTFDRDLARLDRALREEQVYLTPGLSIGDLARRLEMPEYRLRAMINRRLGYRNFNALLHDYRIRDASERLSDPDMTNLPILTIALDVGYQSITPFNQAFRESMGCTPSVYRQQHSRPA